jgi:hypothetical protein
MKPLIIAASVFSAALTFAAVPALAADTPTSCDSLHSQAKAALEGASGDAADQARKETRDGVAACNTGYWQLGVAHYHKALALLGK